MGSIAWATIGLLFLLVYPYDQRLLAPVAVLTVVPYALALTYDLRRNGYRTADVLRVYGFNLILLPVNLAGVLKSLQQAITGRKLPFARTPKVRERTAVPAWYVLAPVLIIGWSAYTLVHEYRLGNWASVLFAGANTVLATWAAVACIGVVAAAGDVLRAIGRWTVVPRGTPAPAPAAAASEPDWRSVLYHGTAGDPTPDASPAPPTTSSRDSEGAVA